jgi:pimeloyl-ACP methyl ester carboxylesterase
MAKYESNLLGATVVTDAGVIVDPARVHELFFGDSDASTAAALAARLRPMPLSGVSESAEAPAWMSVPSTYVVCTNDQALPPDAQRWMATRAQDVVEWPTDHSPFVTRPAELADLLVSYLQ